MRFQCIDGGVDVVAFEGIDNPEVFVDGFVWLAAEARSGGL